MSYIPYRKAEVVASVLPKYKEYNYIYHMEFIVVLPCELHSCENVALNEVFKFLKDHGVKGNVDVKITEGLYTLQRLIRLPMKTRREEARSKDPERKGREQEASSVKIIDI